MRLIVPDSALVPDALVTRDGESAGVLRMVPDGALGMVHLRSSDGLVTSGGLPIGMPEWCLIGLIGAPGMVPDNALVGSDGVLVGC
jgi:hypothetical protein